MFSPLKLSDPITHPLQFANKQEGGNTLTISHRVLLILMSISSEINLILVCDTGERPISHLCGFHMQLTDFILPCFISMCRPWRNIAYQYVDVI